MSNVISELRSTTEPQLYKLRMFLTQRYLLRWSAFAFVVICFN